MTQILINFFLLSTSYLSFALGLALVFGIMRVVNYAHGELYMLGGYVLLGTMLSFRGVFPAPVIFIGALLLAAILIGLVGILIQVGIVQRLRDQPFSIFMATLGLSYMLQVLVIEFVGPSGRAVPPLFPGIVRIADAIIPIQRLVASVSAVLMMVGLWFFLMRTEAGRAVRALAQNRTGAVLQGISVRRIELVTLMIGAGLAAIAGVLSGSVLGVTPFMGGEAIWRAFLIIIVGGIGSIPGAVAAAFLFGALDTTLAALGYGRFVAMTDALIMLAILSFRPNGLLGVKE
jgi:branched-subunit amino acid ABC-type transport system permease component